ncbi:hypothetical protein D3C84_1094250 [compost metagenome]
MQQEGETTVFLLRDLRDTGCCRKRLAALKRDNGGCFRKQPVVMRLLRLDCHLIHLE